MSESQHMFEQTSSEYQGSLSSDLSVVELNETGSV